MDFWQGGGSRDGQLTVWSSIQLNGRVFPGADGLDDLRACKVVVEGGVRFARDKQKPIAKSGKRVIAKGYDPQTITLKVHIWREEQYAAYLEYLDVINPKLKENRDKVHTIEHPDLDALLISELVIEEIGTPQDGQVWGERVVTIKGTEYFLREQVISKELKGGTTDVNADTGVPIDAGFVYDAGPPK